jgi:hypothetical protein
VSCGEKNRARRKKNDEKGSRGAFMAGGERKRKGGPSRVAPRGEREKGGGGLVAWGSTQERVGGGGDMGAAAVAHVAMLRSGKTGEGRC